MLLVELMLVVIDVSQEELILGLAWHHGLAGAAHAGTRPCLLIIHHVYHLFKPDIGSNGWFSSQ